MRQLTAIAAALGLCILTGALAKGDTTAANSSDYAAISAVPTPPVGGPVGSNSGNNGSIHVDGGMDYTTADFFRGIRQTPQTNEIFQGYLDVFLNLEDTGTFRFGPYVGVRGGGAKMPDNGAPLTDYLNEYYAGLAISVSSISATVGYVEHHSPDGSFATQNEVGARIDINDAGSDAQLNVPFALNPHIGLFREVLDQNVGPTSIRSQPGQQNSYLEIGLTPRTSIPLGSMAVTLALPITCGMSWDNYYSLTPTSNSNFFGFQSAGLMAALTLPFPPSWGTWDLRGGITYMHDSAEGAIQIDRGHRDFFFGGAGIGLHY
jgi:hypothetical protein